MSDSVNHSAAFWAIVFEASLVVIAAILGWLFGLWPILGQWQSISAADLFAGTGWGLLAAVPMIACIFVAEHLPFRFLKELERFANTHILPMFCGASIVQLAAVSVAAGIGEELLFRGVLQAGLAKWIGGSAGIWVGLFVASIAFGICHWVSRTYAIVAGMIGLYLGGLLLVSGNLLAPIVAHAFYDFVALIYLLKQSGNRPVDPNSEYTL